MATARATMATARLSSGAFASGSRGSRGASPEAAGPRTTSRWGKTRRKPRERTRRADAARRRASSSYPRTGASPRPRPAAAVGRSSGKSPGGLFPVFSQGHGRARRRRQQMSDHWRKIMSLGGVEGAAPEDVSRRGRGPPRSSASARPSPRSCTSSSRSNKGADVMAAEVKRLKVQKLRLKDDAARPQGEQLAVARSRSWRGLLRLRLPGPRRATAAETITGPSRRTRAARGRRLRGGSRSPSIDACQMARVERLMKRDPNEKGSFEKTENHEGRRRRQRPLLERAIRVARVAKPPRPTRPRSHHFGRAARVRTSGARVLVMDLHWPVARRDVLVGLTGGPISRLRGTLMIADQATASGGGARPACR